MTAVITSDIALAVTALNAGDVIALPTETVYGLAARIDRPDAVRRIFDIKGRPYDHPLIVHECSLERARRWAVFNEVALTLAFAFWPGPLTLLLPRTKSVPDAATGGRDTVAVRVPAHDLARAIIEDVDCGIVAPSANRFGKVSPTTARHVVDDLGDDVSIVIDGGDCSVGVESTIVDCTTDVPQVLRPGAITQKQIEETLGRSTTGMSGPSRAPGMLEAHYAPRCKVELVDDSADAQARRSELSSDGLNVVIIDRTDDLDEYARELYADLRRADSVNADLVVAVLPRSEGIGAAIVDRLRKAAAAH